MADSGDIDDLQEVQRLFRETVEENIRSRCQGECKYCGAPHGGPTAPYQEWEDLLSWVFGYCSNKCRLAAGQPKDFDVQRVVEILHPKPS